MIVGVGVVHQRRLKFCGFGEAGLLHDVADAAVKALDHAVGLRVSWRRQAVFDGQCCAHFIERVFAGGLFGFAGKAVGELAAVIGQDFADFHRCCLV